MGGLNVKVLGGVALTYDGRPLALARKPLELLCLLIVKRGDVASDDWLTEHLWHGEPPPTSAAAMRVHVAKLRAALEPHRAGGPSSRLTHTVGGWRLRLEEGELDASDFEASIAQAAAAVRGGSSESAWRLVNDALGMWSAEPFVGLDAEPIVEERQRLEGIYRRLAALRWQAGLDSGRAEQVASEIELQLAREPDDESVVELAARAAYLMGRQTHALALLRAHRRRMATELGLQPRPEIGSLERRILSHDVQRPGPAHTDRAPTTSRSLVGRATLVRDIVDAVNRADVVRLVGGPGMGKSTVLEALSFPELAVLRARCAANATPLRAVHDLVASSTATPHDAAGWGAFRSRWLMPLSPGDDLSSVTLLAEDLLLDLTRTQPTLLCIDDAQRLDPASAWVLSRVVASGPAKLLLVSPLHVELAAPFDARGEQIIVPPLTDQAAREMLARLRPGGSDARLPEDEVLAAADGSPWLIEALATRAPGQALGTSLLFDLPENTRGAARLVSVLAGPVPLSTMEALIGAEALEHLLVARLLVLHGGRARFRHELVAAAVRDATEPAHLAKLAADIFSTHRDELEPLDLRLAVDLAGALVDDRTAAGWALDAAQQALATGGTVLAGDLTTMAEQRASGDMEVVGRARHIRAHALSADGDFTGAREWYVRAIESLQVVGDDDAVADALVAYVGMLAPVVAEAPLVEAVARWLVQRGRLSSERTLAILDARASAALELGTSVAEKAQLLQVAAEESTLPLATVYRSIALWRSALDRGAPHHELLLSVSAGVDQARLLGETALLVRCLRGRLDHLLGSGRGDEARTCLEELAVVSREARHAQGRWWAQLMGAEAAIRTGDLADGLTLSRDAYSAWGLVPEEPRAEVLRMQSLMVAYQSGRLEEVAGELEQTAPIAQSSRSGLLQSAAALAVAAELGDAVRPEDLEHVVDAVLRHSGPGWLEPATLYFLGRAAVLTERGDRRLRLALAAHTGTWALLGTGAATAGPIDAVLAGLERLEGDDHRTERLGRRAEVLCARMRAPFWSHDARHLAYG